MSFSPTVCVMDFCDSPRFKEVIFDTFYSGNHKGQEYEIVFHERIPVGATIDLFLLENAFTYIYTRDMSKPFSIDCLTHIGEPDQD